MRKNTLGFVGVEYAGKKVAMLASRGELIPGQCAIRIDEMDKHGARKVTVIFEVYESPPEDCATEINMK